MCGIAGIFNRKMSQEMREQAVRQMILKQQHRGPDDQGVFSSGSVTIGMCRLSIFDPANGRQPMATPDGRFHIVFNGAIYNHRELRAELEKLGWGFRTQCDTEVLLAACVQWGRGCAVRLRGMFVFALLDTLLGTMLIVRGPLGVKPLYFAQLPGDAFVFASEIKAIFASGLTQRVIDPVAMGDYLAWFAVPAPRTIYQGVANLPPGHQITVSPNGRCQLDAWWKLPQSSAQAKATSYPEFTRQLRNQLDDTIRAHSLADVPVGAFLSGGIDSSAIVGLMAANRGAKLKTFSLIFEERGYSEQAAAAEVANALQTDHHEEILTGARVALDLPKILNFFDQPTGDGINTYYISRAAQQGGVRVALSGLGGDEIFGGYPSFRDMPRFARWMPYWRQLPQALRVKVIKRLKKGSARKRKLADFLEHARDLHELCSLRRRILSETTRIELLAPEARRLAERQGPNHPRLDDFVFELMGADSFQICSAWEMRTYMTDVLLRDSDVFSMANSLELRVPFVDRTLIEWWWNQPLEYRYDPNRPKSALIDATRDVVPLSIGHRPKRGFTLPFPIWMRRELRPFLLDTFSSSSLNACPWLDAKGVEAAWRSFDGENSEEEWTRIWTLAVLIHFSQQKI